MRSSYLFLTILLTQGVPLYIFIYLIICNQFNFINIRMNIIMFTKILYIFQSKMPEIQEKIRLYQQQRKRIIKQNKSILPAGTCPKEEFQSFSHESLNTLLDSPLYYDLTLPTELCMCILVRKNVYQNQNQGLHTYHLYEERTRRHLLSAQKQPNNIGCNYIISCSQTPKKSQFFIGKLRGNFRNNQFNIYDGGENPDKKPKRKRKQLAFIKYNDSSIFGKKEPSCQIILPKPQQTSESTNRFPKYHPRGFIPQTSSENLLYQQYQSSSSKVLGLINQSSLNQKNIQKLYQSSHNDFYFIQAEQNILIQNQNKQDVLTFLKRSQNSYFLKIGSPFNLVQALGYAIAHLEKNSS